MKYSKKVTQTAKDRDGDITGLCGPWGLYGKIEHVSSETAIRQIERDQVKYYVQDKQTSDEVDIIVMPADVHRSKYLKTKQDGSIGNNLDELPDCNC